MSHPSENKKCLLGQCFVVALYVFYTASVLGFLTLRMLLRDLSPFLALVNSFVPFLFAPLLFALPLMLFIRSKVATISMAVVTILFLGLYAPLFLPRFDSPVVSTSDKIEVMTFNLGLDRSRPEQVVAAIDEEQADIVVVQEMTPAIANLLREELGDRYPHAVLEPEAETIGLLSRYPILASQWLCPEIGGRSYLHAVVDWNGARLNIFAVHPLLPGLSWYRGTLLPIGLHDAEQQQQLVRIARQAIDLRESVLMMGDFNISDQTHAYMSITEDFTDAYWEAGYGFGFTFPRGVQLGEFAIPGPLIRLDYIFHTDDLYAERARVECKGGSDHCYIVAQLARPGVGSR
jgi:endonuclease/exonuclease/phosphatase (EEP) superfamily protein YafD